MTLVKFIKLYLIALTIFLVVDMIWLGLIAKNIYTKYLGFIMAKKINWTAAIIFYLLFIVGLIVFVVAPALETKSIIKALLLAILFGLVTYATYDLTNLATIKNWPLAITIIDLIWGMIISSVVTLITFLIGKKI